MDWPTIQGALHDWVNAVVQPMLVIWADQNINAPPTQDFCAIRINQLIEAGSYEDIRKTSDTPEAEMEHKVVITYQMPIEIICLTRAIHGNDAALAVLGRVRGALHLPATRDALAASGLIPYRIGAIRNLTELVETDFEGRAALEAFMYLQDVQTETSTFIQTTAVGMTLT